MRIVDKLIEIMQNNPELCSDGEHTFKVNTQEVWIANTIFDCDTRPNKGSFNFISDAIKFKKALKEWRLWKIENDLRKELDK